MILLISIRICAITFNVLAIILTVSCYSCHDESPYCGNIINNPASIATAKCQSKCFIRKQDNS